MALQGLRGQGFSPVSPAPFQQMRNNREQNAQRIMEARDARNERKKEKDKENKEADRKLKEEFDKAKQEAVLLGMSQGQATSMSLGALKGWVSASREQKVNAEKMQRMQIEYENHKANMEERATEQKRKKNFDAGAQQALKRPNAPSNSVQPIFQNVEQLKGFQNTQAQMRTGGPLRIDQVTPTTPKGQPPQPPVNVMQGLGMKPSVMQGMGGDNRPRPFDINNPNNPNPKNPTGVYTKTGAYHANPRLNKKPPTFQQFDPTKDTYEVDEEGTRRLIQKGQTTGGVYSPEELEIMKTQYQRLMDELNEGPPDDVQVHQRGNWADRKTKLMTEIGDTLQRAKASARSSQAPQTMQSNTMSSPQELFDQYFDSNGETNQAYMNEALKGRRQKAELIQLFVSRGLVTPQQGTKMLSDPPYGK